MYTFCVRDKESTVYGAVAEVLRAKQHWTERGRVSGRDRERLPAATVASFAGGTLRVNLILGERNGLPFGKLGRL